MYLLYVLGQMLEPVLGHVKFALVYFVSLFTGSLGALIVSPHALTVGASGAVFGLMGAAAMEMRARQIPIMQSGIGFLILINLAISFTIAGISWGGHVGGLIGGGLVMLLLQLGDRYRQQTLALAGSIVIGTGAFLGGIAVAKSSEIHGCHPKPNSRSALPASERCPHGGRCPPRREVAPRVEVPPRRRGAPAR